jgi:hypothetical protein
MADEFHLNGTDTPDAVEETEDLEVIRKNLSDLKRGDSPTLSLSKQDISLLKQLLHAPENADAFIKIIQICDFLDEEEANRELDAFYEADRLGMNTNYNIAHALSRSSINRKGAHNTSRIGALLDTLSHQKFTTNQPKGSGNGNKNSNSPIS